MQRNGPLPRHPTARREREPPSWPVLALCAGVPVALVVLLTFPVLLVAAGLALLAAGGYAGLRRRRPQWRPLQRVSWLFARLVRSRIGVRRRP